MTLGIARLILHWNTEWLVKCTASKCSLSICNYVLVKYIFFLNKNIYFTIFRDNFQNITYRPVHIIFPKDNKNLFHLQHGDQSTYLNNLRYFSYRKFNYFWHPNGMFFGSVSELDGIVINFIFFYKFVQ